MAKQCGLKEYEAGNISDVQYMDRLHENFGSSGLTGKEYVRKTNGGLAWELEVKEIKNQFENGNITFSEYESKIVKLCVQYDLEPEIVVNYINNGLADNCSN